MAKVKVTLRPDGMKALLNDPGVAAEVHRRAEAVAARARASAPVASGAYRDSIHVQDARTDRAVARVVASVPYALLVESKTGNLTRALDAAGGA